GRRCLVGAVADVMLSPHAALFPQDSGHERFVRSLDPRRIARPSGAQVHQMSGPRPDPNPLLRGLVVGEMVEAPTRQSRSGEQSPPIDIEPGAVDDALAVAV